MRLYDLKVNHMSNPVGINPENLRFSWKIKSSGRDVCQESYHITVSDQGRILWDSGVVASAQTQNILYGGEALKSRQILQWALEVRTNRGVVCAASGFEIGLLERTDWKGMFIEPEEEDADIMQPVSVPYLRKTFSVGSGLKKARIYHTAHGSYRFWINGEKGSDRVFAPGDTNYLVRLQYQVDDIAGLLQPGENVWAVRLGDGWWRGGYGASGTRCNYGRRVHYMGQLELEYEDGRREIIPTDESFKTAFGGLREADPKTGTVYDASM